MIKDLKFVTPEQEGLKSKYLSEFIDVIEDEFINLHSFMFVRNGNILLEGYYKPFNKDFKHRIYSCSKTYTALAIGYLVTIGKLKITDRIIDFFPEYNDDLTPEEIKNITIEDMLTMRVCLPHDSYVTFFPGGYGCLENGWVEAYFRRLKPVKPNGMKFNYNTSSSYMLNVIAEKLTGKTYLEVLRPVFDELGVSKDITCVKSPDGYSWGGSGVITTLRDYAKVAEFLLNKGKVNGKYLIDKEYMEKAVSPITDAYDDLGITYDCFGYGYQIWTTDKGYAMLGMGGQLAYIFPDKNAFFVCNADTQFNNTSSQVARLYAFVKIFFYNKLGEKLPENKSAYDNLTKKLSSLKLNVNFGKSESSSYDKFNKVTYVIKDEKSPIKEFTLDLDNGKFKYLKDGEEKTINFKIKEMVLDNLPETKYYYDKVHTPAGFGLKTTNYGTFVSDNKFLLSVQVIDLSFGQLQFAFEVNDKGNLSFEIKKKAEFFLDEYRGNYFATKK